MVKKNFIDEAGMKLGLMDKNEMGAVEVKEPIYPSTSI